MGLAIYDGGNWNDLNPLHIMKVTDVPAIWQHLPFHRGYPVPYFVHWDSQPDGSKVPNFHIADNKKWITCLKHKRCWICGKELSAVSYMVTGPKGLANRVGTDTFMHEACARESLRLCPHMVYQKTTRRDADTDTLITNPHLDMDKPTEIALVKTGKFQLVFTGQSILINYQPVAVQWFHYINEMLAPKDEKLIPVDSMGWKVAGFGIVPLSKL